MKSGSSSDDECSAEKDRDVLQVYNEAMSSIASPLSFRLVSEWDLATANERALCLDQVDEACRAVCSVIAPRDSEELLQAFEDLAPVNVFSNDPQALIVGYKNAPSRNLKTQILSILSSALFRQTPKENARTF